MNRLPDIPTNIYEDEIIDFMAEHHQQLSVVEKEKK